MQAGCKNEKTALIIMIIPAELFLPERATVFSV
jgi:hypothetical protein